MPTLAVIWRAAGLLLAIDAGSVVEVLPPVACRPVPGVPAWVRGVFVHRGDLVPLVDAERLLSGLDPAPAQPPAAVRSEHTDRMRNRVLALRIAAADGVPEWRLGLLVECILDLERLDFTGAGSHPGFDADAARFLGPVASTRFGLVQLVRVDELFTPEQARVLMHRISEAAA